MNNQFKPTTINNRIEILDALRGFAVFGILLSNILIISGYYLTNYSILGEMHLSSLNNSIFMFSFITIIGKAYPVFCMLFGVSFFMQYLKFKDENESFVKFYLWRMLLLFVLGIMHLFIWPGDVVHYYAALSILLIPFRKLSSNKLLILAIVLVLAALSFGVYEQFFTIKETTESVEQMAAIQFEGVEFFELKDKIQNEGLKGMWFFNNQQYNILYTLTRLKTSVLIAVALFIIGMILYKKDLLSGKMYNWKYLVSFLILGLIGKTLIYYVGYSLRFVDHIFTSLFFITLFGIVFKTSFGNKLLEFFKPVGRMAFTNYVLQSILASFVFYGIGMGLFSEIPLYGIYLIALSILLFQTILSIIWLRKYRFGPIEWLWRSLTYKRNFSLENKL